MYDYDIHKMRAYSFLSKRSLISCYMSKQIGIHFCDQTDYQRLTHNVFGPHDEKFHRLWNELRADYEALVRKGYTGEGFLSAGKKLGGSGVHPIHEARRLARAAAEKRGLKSAPGPRRIGGAPPSDGVDIRKTIADAAQHRRDTLKGCGNTDAEPGWKAKVLEETKRNEIQTDAGIDDADMRAIEQAFIEMLQEDEELRAQSSLPFSPSRDALSERKLDDPPNLGEMGPPSRPSKSKPAVVSPSTTSNPQTSRCTIGPQVSGDVHENGWTCQICTFENPETFLCCEVCLIDRHSGPAAIDSIPDHDSERPRSVRSGPNQPPGDHKILRSRSSATNIARFEEAEAMRVNSKPVGWTCHCCGTFMETHWWTCSQCGTMKLNS